MFLANESELSILFHPRRLRSLFYAICLAGFVMTGTLASAAEQADGTGKATAIAFDVASQPLEAALDAFSSSSNVQVLYETSLTSGRRSAKVQGMFTPEAALNAMLAGTGLTAWPTTQDSYSLVAQQDDGGHRLAQPQHFVPRKLDAARPQTAGASDDEQLFDRRLAGFEQVVVDELRRRELNPVLARDDDKRAEQRDAGGRGALARGNLR